VQQNSNQPACLTTTCDQFASTLNVLVFGQGEDLKRGRREGTYQHLYQMQAQLIVN
jgi:hypothetical protein